MEKLRVYLKRQIRDKQFHLESIRSEGMSVVEYALDKSDVSTLKEELKNLQLLYDDCDKTEGIR